MKKEQMQQIKAKIIELLNAEGLTEKKQQRRVIGSLRREISKEVN